MKTAYPDSSGDRMMPGNQRAVPPAASSFLNRLQQILEDRYSDENFQAGELSRLFCLCPMQVYRKVKQHTGFTPGRLITRFRMARALKLLLATDWPVAEIAYRTGFRSPNYFSRVFRKQTGLSPSEARRCPDTLELSYWTLGSS